MQADSRERGCSYLGRDRTSFVLLATDQSAESIVVEPNLCLMTRLVSGSEQREGNYEGRNIEQRTTLQTWTLSIMGDRIPMTNHSFRWERCKVQLVKRAFALFGEPPSTWTVRLVVWEGCGGLQGSPFPTRLPATFLFKLLLIAISPWIYSFFSEEPLLATTLENASRRLFFDSIKGIKLEYFIIN